MYFFSTLYPNSFPSFAVHALVKQTVYKRFMGFKAAQSLTASSLFQYIKEILSVHNVDILKFDAQTYDGASVMSRKNNGVQALFC